MNASWQCEACGDRTDKLALRPREAAAMLGISGRTLWTWTKAGLLPYVKIGRTLRYPADDLRRWISQQAARNVAPESETEGPGQ
jgi:excisionase family DNA binding protein